MTQSSVAKLTFVDVEANFTAAIETFFALTFTTILSWNTNSKLITLTVGLTRKINFKKR